MCDLYGHLYFNAMWKGFTLRTNTKKTQGTMRLDYMLKTYQPFLCSIVTAIERVAIKETKNLHLDLWNILASST